jgi:hypothetical protein
MSVLEQLRQNALEIDVDRFEDTLLAEATAKPTVEVATEAEIKWITDLAVAREKTQNDICSAFQQKFGKSIDQSTVAKYKKIFMTTKAYFCPAKRGPKFLLDDKCTAGGSKKWPSSTISRNAL